MNAEPLERTPPPRIVGRVLPQPPSASEHRAPLTALLGALLLAATALALACVWRAGVLVSAAPPAQSAPLAPSVARAIGAVPARPTPAILPGRSLNHVLLPPKRA